MASKKDKIEKTAIGRAINIIKIAISVPDNATSGNLDGKANNPNIKNRTICISQEIPSKKLDRLFLL